MHLGDQQRCDRKVDQPGSPVGMADPGMVARRREPAAVLFQREIVTATEPGFVIDGAHVDVNDVLAPDFGQWDLARQQGELS